MKIEITPKETELLLKCINRAIKHTGLFAEEHTIMGELYRNIVAQYNSYTKTYKFMFKFKKSKMRIR